MNVKKNIHSRIRGWLPKEPSLTGLPTINMQFRKQYKIKEPPSIIPAEYHLSFTKYTVAFTVFFILIYGFMFFITPPEKFTISALQSLAWIIAGLAAGTIIGKVFTNNQLVRLSENIKTKTTAKDLFFLVVPLIAFFILGYFASTYFYAISVYHLQGLLISIYSLEVSLLVMRCYLLYAFEKRENMRIVNSWFGLYFFLVPKAPTDLELKV
jgi:hypothetical protein